MNLNRLWYPIAALMVAFVACGPATVVTVIPTLTPQPAPTATPTATAGIANPASGYCVAQGGQSEIRTAADGSQVGYCVFSDGSACEEWAYFRGECVPGSTPSGGGCDVPTDRLIADVKALLPAGTFATGDLQVIPLVSATDRSLWAIYSYGMRNFELDPLPSHFVAIYTYDCDDAAWQQLAWLDLDEPDANGVAVMPDYISEDGVVQVAIDPLFVFLEVQGGVGAHGGTYQLLFFDGSTFQALVSGVAAGPGAGRTRDVNEDGVLDVVLDQSDAYVFCYACGVRKVMYQVFYWDAPNVRMLEARIDYYYMGQPQPMRDVLNPAVEMANAGLWKDALVQIAQARDLLPSYPEADPVALNWDYALIKLHADAMAADAATSPYPILANVFYGDYDAAVNLMRPFTPAQIFDAVASPLIVGTPAEGMQDALASHLISSADAALAIKPTLAPAYFLRGWGKFLLNPADVDAGADVAQAVALAPGDAFYAQCAAYVAP